MPDMEQTIKQLQDTLTVMEGIQARQAEVLKGHSQWLEEHLAAIARHDKEIAESRELGKATDERIEKLVSAIGKLINKQG
jgi:hypothetical protein